MANIIIPPTPTKEKPRYKFPYSRTQDSDLRQLIEMYYMVHHIPEEWIEYYAKLNLQWTDFQKDLDSEWNDYQIQLNKEWNIEKKEIQKLIDWVNSYFDELDVQDEINYKINNMIKTGEFQNIIRPLILASQNPIFVNNTSEMTDTSRIYVLSSTGIVHQYASGAGWSSTGLVYGMPQNMLTSNNTTVGANYQTVLPDLNTTQSNMIYRMFWAGGTTALPLNMPEELNPYPSDAWISTFMTFGPLSGTINYYNTQIIINHLGIWIRFSAGTPTSGQWNPWSRILNRNQITYIPTNVGSGGTSVASTLPDLNKANLNTVYRLFQTGGSNDVPDNMPIELKPYPTEAWISTIITNGRINNTINPYNTQQIINSIGTWYRYTTSSSNLNQWSQWKRISNSQTSIVITVKKSGGEMYTSLTKAVKENTQKGTKIIVLDGDYNIYNEYLEYYNSNFWRDYEATNTDKGLIIKNGIDIIFYPNTKVTFNASSSFDAIHGEFSPFNVSEGGGSLQNLVLESSNCRYSIHDDLYSNTVPYEMKYINCNIKQDNTNNTNGTSYTQCIGGGFGKSGSITIEGCIFESIHPQADNITTISYHTTTGKVGASYLRIEGNYIRGKGKINISGVFDDTNPNKSRIIISNNSLGTATAISQGNSFEVLQWNNEIRTL